MDRIAFGAALLALVPFSAFGASEGAPPSPRPVAPATPLGSGAYPAVMEEDTGLPGHTLYRPHDLAALGNRKLPIVVWGNGGCANNGSAFRWFLTEIASYGFVVIANGAIGSDPVGFSGPPPPMRARPLSTLPPPATHTSQLIDAINWAVAENGREGSNYHGRLAPEKIAVMGQSCGGVQAIEASADPRVKTSMVWNSGLFPEPTTMAGGRAMTKAELKALHAPTAYISGDAEDVAFSNANDDFERIEGIPVFRAYERGIPHGGTYSNTGGGEFGGVAVAWLLWQFEGDRNAGRMFSGSACGLCVNPRWVVHKKHID